MVGDASAYAVDEAVDAVAAGDAPAFERLYRRLTAAGTAGFTVAGAAQRHFDMLHRTRALVDRGADPESALGPGVFWKRKPLLIRQLESWPLPRIERALAILDRTIIDSRLKSGIATEVVGQGMLMVAALAARPGAGRVSRRIRAPAVQCHSAASAVNSEPGVFWRRNSCGVSPVSSLKARVKCAWSE